MINSVMSPIECYSIYVSLKAHFQTQKYDYFKYRSPKTISELTFNRRNDKNYFCYASQKYRRYEFLQVFLSNYLIRGDFWIGDIGDTQTHENWKGWLGKIQNFPYWFGVDCRNLFRNCSKVSDAFVCPHRTNSYTHPKIFRMVISREILTETFITLDRILSFSKAYHFLNDDSMWNNFHLKIQKYEPFLGDIDIPKYRSTLKQVLKECDSFHENTFDINKS